MSLEAAPDSSLFCPLSPNSSLGLKCSHVYSWSGLPILLLACGSKGLFILRLPFSRLMLSSAATLFLESLWVSYESYRGLFGRKIVTYINRKFHRKITDGLQIYEESLPFAQSKRDAVCNSISQQEGVSQSASQVFYFFASANHKGVPISWKFTISVFLIATPSVYTLYVNKTNKQTRMEIPHLTDK